MSSFVHIVDDAVKLAVYTRFATYLGLTSSNTDAVFFPKEIAQRKIAEKRGEATVEFINVWRTGIQYDWNRQNTAIARKGLKLNFEDSSTKANIATAKAVPTIVDYDFWVWSRDLDKMTQVIESYMLWQHDHPNIILSYNDTYPMELYLKFGPVIDETDIPNMYAKGLYYVSRFPLRMEGWVLTDFSFDKTVLSIILDVYLRQGAGPDYTDTLLNEWVITSDT